MGICGVTYWKLLKFRSKYDLELGSGKKSCDPSHKIFGELGYSIEATGVVM